VGVKLAAVLLLASLGIAGGSSGVTVKSAFVPALGKTVLVDASGRTLYRNRTEKGGRIRCTGACAAAWPPLLVPAGARVTAGAGVAQAKLGTVLRPGGKRQATYAGQPLYRFAADRRAGQAKGQALGGVWFAIAPASSTPAPPPPPPPPATAPPPPTDTGGYGYG
jgi:predicted lipoprotein with Yx(FWY)xxD motif